MWHTYQKNPYLILKCVMFTLNLSQNKWHVLAQLIYHLNTGHNIFIIPGIKITSHITEICLKIL